MRAFLVTGRAIISFYNDLFLLIGLSLLWWVTGGIFVGLAFLAMILGFQVATQQSDPLLFLMNPLSNPFLIAPLIAIPAGPATAALANVSRQSARDLRADRSFYFDAFRMYWKKALGIAAVSAVVLSLLLMNLLFYLSRAGTLLQVLAFLWAYLVVFWAGVMVYQFPVLIGLVEPTVWSTLRTSVAMTFANPLFSIFIVVIAGALTVLSGAIPILMLMAWPAVISLLGEHSLKLFVEIVRGQQEKQQQEDESPK